RTVRFHTYLSRATGAAAGFGGALTMAPDMASLAWMQSRMLVFIAAAYGLDPNDRERAAEILVLQQVARDLPSARAALDGSGPTIASHYVDGKLSGNEGLVRVLTRTIFRHGAHRLAGRAIPGFAIFYNSWANARATRVLGRRARRWYKEHANELPARAAAAEPARVSA
ncbi:MAG: EcsC family protein, partial [Solirubrobacterales bacterium]|nr:EcsC family protein [Solirubrobacterales bacterium]